MSEDILLSLTGVGAETADPQVEERVAQALDLPSDKVSIIERDGDQILLVVYSTTVDSPEKIAQRVTNATTEDKWQCSVPDDEEEVEMDEAQAYELWRDMPAESRTCHLQTVSSPDGEFIQPKHAPEQQQQRTVLEAQLERDPGLLVQDNVKRIHKSLLEEEGITWEEPIIITGYETLTKGSLSREHLMENYGQVSVRTGNRNTLIENGFDNSVPRLIEECFREEMDSEYQTIVFSPVQELPDVLGQELKPILTEFPAFSFCENQKYTVCLAGMPGFGIGMHKHNAAYFWLLQGRKKWYMAPSSNGDGEVLPTHPAFYTTQSTHQCIQQPGEVLYVPNQWYHEIFNLEYTAGIQALPD